MANEDLYAALKAADAAGDTAGARKLAQYIQALPVDGGVKAATPTRESLISQIPGTVRPAEVQPEDSLFHKFAGATIEPAASMATGLIGGVAGPIAGVGKSLFGGKYGTQEGVQQGQDTSRRVAESMTYQPRTQTGQAVTGKIGQILNDSGLIAVAPLSGEMTALSRAAPATLRAAGDTARVEAGYAGDALRTGAAAVINPVADSAQGTARSLMQSAIKPTIAQLRSGDAEVAIKTLLDKGISPTDKGVQKLKALIEEKNAQVSSLIGDSTATVSKQKVLDTLRRDTVPQFAKQVNPTSDLNAIASSADDFANHPGLSGDAIPVQIAQELKQGTYKVLAKKYGQLGTADTEAQKGLARGLKQGISDAVPEVAGLNAEEGALIQTLGVAERRALMDINKNPMGLAALATSPSSWAAFMADRSAAFKALAARALNRLGESARVEKPTFSKVGPQPDNVMPGQSNISPYDWRNATDTQNWRPGRPEPASPDVTVSPEPLQPSLTAPSANETLRGLAGRRAFDRNMSASLDQAAESASEKLAAATRQTTGRGTLFDLDPITGRLREASQGIKGATPETFQNFGNALQSASEKVAAGQNFAMSAAEKVAWDKTRVDLATASPELTGLSDVAVAAKMMDRNWVASAVTKAREKAAAFDQIAQRANDAQAVRAAAANRERMLDLLETLQEKMGPKPTRSNIQGQKTREHNLLGRAVTSPQTVQPQINVFTAGNLLGPRQ